MEKLPVNKKLEKWEVSVIKKQGILVEQEDDFMLKSSEKLTKMRAIQDP